MDENAREYDYEAQRVLQILDASVDRDFRERREQLARYLWDALPSAATGKEREVAETLLNWHAGE
jgi:hypothetical protein